MEAEAPIKASLSRASPAARLCKAASATAQSPSYSTRRAELETCGALRYRDAAERELRKLGHRVLRRTRPGKADGTGIEMLTDPHRRPRSREHLQLSPSTD